LRTLAEWLTLQESVHPKTIDMGLGRVTAVARALGVDKPACPVITVGGTNGKGSTAVHLEGLLGHGGASTGLFTSPHFLRYNERIRVDGLEVHDEELIAAFERIEGARGSTTLTFFEFNTLAALVIFAERSVDVAVLEVGLGGRLDAVNLVDADVAVVCSVGFDHRDYLGDTLDLIGAEKAGIFRPGRPAVLGTDEMPASVYAAIASMGARPVVAGKDFSWRVEEASANARGARWSYNGLRLSLRDLSPSALAGSIQYRNASTALAAVEALEQGMSAIAATPGRRRLQPLQLNELTVSEALRGVRLAGRFQVVQVPVMSAEHSAARSQPWVAGVATAATPSVEWILDIAHNEPAAAIFARHVREQRMSPVPFSTGSGSLPAAGAGKGPLGGRTFAVVGILGDKDAKAIASLLEPLVDHWILCALPGPRGTSAEHLAERLRLPPSEMTLAASVEAGCEIARVSTGPGDRVLVFGSFYTVGPALSWLGIY
jgi:dihydrofolate synthase / folylpolyglutamate synthase